MKLAYDSDAGALYIGLADRSGKVARTVAVDDGTNVDLAAGGELLGIEVISPHRNWPLDEILKRYEVSKEDAVMLMSAYPCWVFSAQVA